MHIRTMIAVLETILHLTGSQWMTRGIGTIKSRPRAVLTLKGTPTSHFLQIKILQTVHVYCSHLAVLTGTIVSISDVGSSVLVDNCTQIFLPFFP